MCVRGGVFFVNFLKKSVNLIYSNLNLPGGLFSGTCMHVPDRLHSCCNVIDPLKESVLCVTIFLIFTKINEVAFSIMRHIVGLFLQFRNFYNCHDKP